MSKWSSSVARCTQANSSYTAATCRKFGLFSFDAVTQSCVHVTIEHDDLLIKTLSPFKYSVFGQIFYCSYYFVRFFVEVEYFVGILYVKLVRYYKWIILIFLKYSILKEDPLQLTNISLPLQYKLLNAEELIVCCVKILQMYCRIVVLAIYT